MKYYKILITGGRYWNNYQRIKHVIEKTLVHEDVPNNEAILINGDCRGADRLSTEAAKEIGIDLILCPANWEARGKAAGVLRNKFMVDFFDPDVVLAFHSSIQHSKGTKHCINYALKKGIKVYLSDDSLELQRILNAI